MSDLSIKNSLSAGNLSNAKGSDTYSNILAEYNKFAAKAKNSDFRNAPTLLNQELELLNRLKEAAINETQIEWINERIAKINKELETGRNDEPLSQIPSYVYQQADKIQSQEDETIESVIAKSQNPQQVNLFAKKLESFKIKPDDIKNIIKMMAVPASDNTDSFFIPEESLRSVLAVGNALNLYTDNEVKEAASPLYTKNITKENDGVSVIIKRNNKVIYSKSYYDTIMHPETEEEKHSKYEKLMNEQKKQLLSDFIKKYKGENGVIPYQYGLGVNSLKKAGIINSEVLNILDQCIKEDGKLNRHKLYKAAELKEAGALSSSILTLLDACSLDSDGKYKTEDIEAVKTLTKAELGAELISALLPLLKNGDEASQDAISFLQENAQYFEDTNDLIYLVELCKKNDSDSLDPNLLDIIDTFNLYEKNSLNDKDFVKYIEEIFEIAGNSKENVSANAASICYLLTQINASLPEIKNILKLCTNEDGTISDSLNKLLRNICLNSVNTKSNTEYQEEVSVADITQLIELAKKDNNIDNTTVEQIITEVQNGTPIVNILLELME